MNSGGTVTRDMIGAQSYLAMFLLGILKPPQHLVFAPPSILSYPIPFNSFDISVPGTFLGARDTAGKEYKRFFMPSRVLSLVGETNHRAKVTTKYETVGIRECLWNSG